MSALSDLRVIDLSTAVAGPFCAKLFADFGADVIKVEHPQGGDEARSVGPFADRSNPAKSSAFFLYLNTNKRGVTLNAETQQGLFVLRQLVSAADVVVESFLPGTMERLGLGFDELQQLKPGIILTSITPFGQDGPWSEFQATDLVEFAASGLSSVNGLASREPLKVPGFETYYQAGVSAFSGAMTAICHRDFGGPGEHVDVSVLEAATTIFGPQILAAQHSGRSPGRRNALRPTGLFPCKDGFISLNVRHEPTWRFMWLFFDEPEMSDDPRFATQNDRRERNQELEELLMPRLARYTMEELFHGLAPIRIMVGMSLDAGQIANDPHLNERGLFVESRHPVAGNVRHPGAPFLMDETPWKMRRPAPALGQHNREIFTGMLGYSPRELDRWRAQEII